MTRSFAVMVVVCGALLVGCSSEGSASTASTASGSGPTSLDDGALLLEPLATSLPADSRTHAAWLLAGSGVGAGAQTAVAARVRVEVPAPTAAAVAEGALQRLDLPHAWAYVVPEAGRAASSCLVASSGHFWPTPSPTPVPTDASRDYVVILDADSGHGYVYAGAGTGPCAPTAVPSLRGVRLQLSVPYEVQRFTPRSARLTVTVPACGRFQSFTPSFAVAGEHRGMATATVPAAPCAGKGSTVVQDMTARFTESPHSAPGLVCGAAYDAEKGRPADCVATG